MISVVVPVFNDVPGIRRLLKRLTAQTVSPSQYEVIAVDNKSTDSTGQVILEYEKRTKGLVKLVREERLQSSYAARNTGVREAKGDIVAFTDSDCVPIPGWIENGTSLFQDSGVSLVAGRIQMVFNAARPNFWEYVDASRKLNQKSYVEDVRFGATANLFVRKSLFNKYGYFLDTLASGGDYEFGRRVTGAGEKLVYAEDALVYHPARVSLKAILKKSRRVAKGQKQLQRLGLLRHGVLSMKSLIPVRKAARLEGTNPGGPLRLGNLLMANFLRYYNIVHRL